MSVMGALTRAVVPTKGANRIYLESKKWCDRDIAAREGLLGTREEAGRERQQAEQQNVLLVRWRVQGKGGS